MPFSLKDPDAIYPNEPTRHTDAYPEAALRPAVEAEATLAVADALAELAAENDLFLLRDAGRQGHRVFATFEANVRAAQADRKSSDEGRQDRVWAAEAARDAGLGKIAEVLSTVGDAMLAKTAPASFPLMSLALAANAQVKIATIRLKLPETTMAESADCLRRALPTAGFASDGALEQNQMLNEVWLPVLRRMEASPPKHWQDLAPRAGALADLIAQHLDGVLDGPKTRVYAEVVGQCRQDFAFLVGMAKANAWDSATFAIACPSLTFEK